MIIVLGAALKGLIFILSEWVAIELGVLARTARAVASAKMGIAVS